MLFLDELTIGLDVEAKYSVRKFIKEINQQSGTTIILTTHDLGDIQELCRRVIIIHNELPDCICPYKHYDAGLTEDVADGVASEDDIETEDYPCAGTMKHWKWWMQMNEANIEGQMREASRRLFGLDGRFLKSAASLLADVRERTSPRRLPAAIRYIYNTGGRIEPYLAAS